MPSSRPSLVIAAAALTPAPVRAAGIDTDEHPLPEGAGPEVEAEPGRRRGPLTERSSPGEQRGGAPAGPREGRLSAPLYDRPRAPGAPLPPLLSATHLRRREHPGEGPGDRHPEPQELLGLLLRRRGDQAPPSFHGQVRALQAPGESCWSASAPSRSGAGIPMPRRWRRHARFSTRAASSPSSPRGRGFATRRSSAGRTAAPPASPWRRARSSSRRRSPAPGGFLGPIPKPKRVQVAFAEPIEVRELMPPPRSPRSSPTPSSGPTSSRSSPASGPAPA